MCLYEKEKTIIIIIEISIININILKLCLHSLYKIIHPYTESQIHIRMHFISRSCF